MIDMHCLGLRRSVQLNNGLFVLKIAYYLVLYLLTFPSIQRT